MNAKQGPCALISAIMVLFLTVSAVFASNLSHETERAMKKHWTWSRVIATCWC